MKKTGKNQCSVGGVKHLFLTIGAIDENAGSILMFQSSYSFVTHLESTTFVRASSHCGVEIEEIKAWRFIIVSASICTYTPIAHSLVGALQ